MMEIGKQLIISGGSMIENSIKREELELRKREMEMKEQEKERQWEITK